MRRLGFIFAIVALAMLVFAACSDNKKGGNATPGSTPPATSATQAVPTPAGPTSTAIISIQTTESPSQAKFARVPIDKQGTATANTTVTTAVSGTFDAYDRMTFQFGGGLPNYQIQYLTSPPTACGSGQTEQLQGTAFLQIRFTPADAHDANGNSTVSSTDISAQLPALLEAKQTCDFEGVVTWVLGLKSEVDFRQFSIGDSLLVVDVNHP